MTPVPIRVPLTSPGAPATFQLAGTGELAIKSVTATVDGSGAGSDFYPVLSVYTQDNRLVSRTKPAETIAAGGSAVVTWAPFLRKLVAATPAGATLDAFEVYKAIDQSINNNSETDVVFDSVAFAVGTPYTTVDDKTFTLEDGYWLLGSNGQWENQPTPTPTTGELCWRLYGEGVVLARDTGYSAIPTIAGGFTNVLVGMGCAVPFKADSDSGSGQIRVTAFQKTGAALKTQGVATAGSIVTNLWGVRVDSL